MGLSEPAGYVHAMECMAARWAVPLFFMISGALLLGRRESMAVVWKRRVLRMALVIAIIWGVQNIYACCCLDAKFGVNSYIHALLKLNPGLSQMTSFATVWFLYAYFFLMLMLPLLRILAQGMRNCHYIYLLTFHLAACCLLPCADALLTGVFRNMPYPLAAPSDVYFGAFFMLTGYFVEHRCQYTLMKRRVLWRLLWGSLLCCILAGLVLCSPGILALDDRQLWAATASTSALPPIVIYVVIRALFRRRRMPFALRKLLAAMGGSVFFVMLTENMWRNLFSSWFDFGDWSLISDIRAWAYAGCVVLCAMLAGMLVKLLPGFRRIF